MLNNIKQSLILSGITIILFGIIYPLFIFAAGQLMPEKSEGTPVIASGRIVGFENIGQSFTEDKYFNGRPSAVGYDAASTGGSNKGNSNPEYLEEVKSRIDTFLVHNPDVNKKDIPSELVTASGSGIDPNITTDAALIQISRIAKVRGISEVRLEELVREYTEKKYLGLLGIEKVNLLKLNIALDKIN
ncbi:MAG: potassium-transporting ATPase subunit KdpC [Ignavibacteria bacterium]|nr:potassium-transporting ATPase subunit KdpC [Ignavibacteria bacterium]